MTILAALSAGHTASQILKYLSQHNPKLASQISSALNAGHTIEHVLNYIARNEKKIGKLIPEKNEISPSSNLYKTAQESIHPSLLGAAKATGVAGATLLAAYGASQFLPASALRGSLLTNPNIGPGRQALNRQLGTNRPQAQLPLMNAQNTTIQQSTPPSPGQSPTNNLQTQPQQPPNVQPQVIPPAQKIQAAISPQNAVNANVANTVSQTPTNIAPQPSQSQPQVNSTISKMSPSSGFEEMLNRYPGFLNKIKELKNTGNNGESISAFFKKFNPSQTKKIEKELGQPIENIIDHYISLESLQPEPAQERPVSSTQIVEPEQNKELIFNNEKDNNFRMKKINELKEKYKNYNIEKTRKDIDFLKNTLKKGIFYEKNQQEIEKELDEKEKIIQEYESVPKEININEYSEGNLNYIDSVDQFDKPITRIIYEKDENNKKIIIDTIQAGKLNSPERTKQLIKNLRTIFDKFPDYSFEVTPLSKEGAQFMNKILGTNFDYSHEMHSMRGDLSEKENIKIPDEKKEKFIKFTNKFFNNSNNIKKNETVAGPQGIGEVKEIRNGQALVEVDGKLHKVKEEELIQSPLPEKELADLYDELVEGIGEKTGQGVSRNVDFAGYDPNTSELVYRPHGGKLYVYDNISAEDKDLLTSLLTQRKSTGENFIGAWTKGTQSPIGAAMYQLIKRLQAERGGKGNEYKNRFEIIYDAFEPARKASQERYAETKKKAKKPKPK